ncbi:MAG: mechanosensitive ion channel family protein [Salinisphaeraceae bacterium]|nr:mechanosensitive ion channel family protein [Salinisphaeraceae bacterium]
MAHDQWGPIAELFIIVFVVVFINFLIKHILNFLHKRVEASENIWDDAVFIAINPPLRVLMWVLGLTFAAEYFTNEAKDSMLAGLIDPVRTVGVIVVLTWFLTRLVSGLSESIIQRKQRKGEPVDPTTMEAIAKLLRMSVVITGALVILQSLGFSISGVLAFGGVGGLAVGLAAKDLLANIFGGLTIYLDRPFSKGDWIRSPEKDIEGVVENIGWRRTAIRRFDKRPLYVPNAVFTNITVENPSRMTNRRIKETMGIRYDDVSKVQPIMDDIREMLNNHEAIDQDLIKLVYFDSFGPHSLDFFVYCLTVTRDWETYHQVKQDVLLKVHDIVEKHGAEMAFPTSTLHVPEPVIVQGLAEKSA